VIEDYFTIDEVEPGKLHLSALSGDEQIVVPVSRDISDASRVGWSISGAMGRKGKDWRILEAWNVYPWVDRIGTTSGMAYRACIGGRRR